MNTTSTPGWSRPRLRGRWLADGEHALEQVRRPRSVGCDATAPLRTPALGSRASIASEARAQPRWLDAFDPTGLLLVGTDGEGVA